MIVKSISHVILFETDLDSELMLFNEEANEVIVYVLA
jgi:hypothetical protein